MSSSPTAPRPAAPAPQGAPGAAMSRTAEIRLVAGRELRAQLLKKSTLISTGVMLILVIGVIVAASLLTGGKDEPYRLGVSGSDAAAVEQLRPALEQVVASNGLNVEVVDLSGKDAAAALNADDESPEHVDMDLALSATPTLTVRQSADDAVVAGVTGLMQQQALSSMIAELGGDPSTVAGSLEQAAPTVRVLNPATEDQEGFQARYAVFMASSMMLYLVILMGGQFIAMGVVEEKSSRIIEILLACVRPTSLLAGKVLGTGASLILCFGLVGTAGAVTAQVTGVMPDMDIDLNATLVVTLVWMVVGYAIFSVLFGAAGALVSRQEDVAGAVMPLTALCVLPFMASLAMFMGDPKQLIWKVLSYIPPLSPYLMPARLVSGVSNWVEQGVALIIALAALPLLVRVSATIYTRAVTRMGSRVPLRQVLSRKSA